MTKRRYSLFFLLTSCSLLFLLLFKDSPYDTELTFSRESGFYNEPFELKIYAPVGTKIYFTLDGSDPDESAELYTHPVMIEDATAHDNVYSMRRDVSAGFLSEDIARYSFNDPGYVTPDYLIDKCTVVKAVYCDVDGNFSEIETRSYFVGYEDKKGYEGLNIISITTDPDNLFHYDSGIYVLGRTYDTYNLQEEEPWWWWWRANYYMRGLEWEREADIQIFDTERKLILDKKCGIRVQGGGSRGRVPRNLNLYAREQYDGEGRFYVDLFGTGYMADTVTLFAGGGGDAKLQDMLMSRLMEDRNYTTMHYIPYAVFLDGEYWGIYWLTEKYDATYLGYTFDIKKKDVVMIKNGELAEGEETDFVLYTDLMKYMEETDLTLRENYEYACELIDMQSYIDYYATEIYIGRYQDWPVQNEALWRTREAEDGEFTDGKWRWMLFDVNSGGLSTDIIEMDTFRITMDRSAMFRNLCRNDEFKERFTVTFMDLINTAFTEANVDSIISEYIALMEEPMPKHLRRFFGTEDMDRFVTSVEDVREFLDKRKPYIVQHLKEDLALDGVLAPVRISVNDKAAGNIMVNTMQISFDESNEWNGEYFTDYPIAITAIANEGYHFVKWEGDISVESETVEINLAESGTEIKAVFEKNAP